MCRKILIWLGEVDDPTVQWWPQEGKVMQLIDIKMSISEQVAEIARVSDIPETFAWIEGFIVGACEGNEVWEEKAKEHLEKRSRELIFRLFNHRIDEDGEVTILMVSEGEFIENVGDLISHLKQFRPDQEIIVDDDGDTSPLGRANVAEWDESDDDSPVAIYIK